MQKKLLNLIIKANLNEKKSLETLIDEFIQAQTSLAKGQLEDFLSSLFIYINRNYDKVPKDELLNILESKLQDLNIQFDTKDIDEVYASIATATSVGTTKVVFDKIDTKAINAMRNGFFWASDKYNSDTQNLLKDMIEETFKGNIPRADLSAALKNAFQGIIDKDENYFKLVADNIISQSQNVSRLNQSLKYGVKYFKVRARIDNKTSDFCRWINGKIIPAKHLKQQLNNILDATNIDDKKTAAPWQSQPIFGVLPANVGLPPYHGRCRTQIEPVWINETIKVDSKTGKEYKIRNTKDDKNYKLTHIDKTGVEVNIKTNIYDKIVNIKHNLTEKQLIGALNSIKYKAPHKITGRHPNEHIKSVALTKDGYTLIYEANELVSCYPPTRRESSYFNDNAILGKVTDVDTGEIKERVKKWYEILI
ncbi:MAG: hypothetical protein ACEQSQ_00135 [Candidatus Paceibacteria bacterium]